MRWLTASALMFLACAVYSCRLPLSDRCLDPLKPMRVHSSSLLCADKRLQCYWAFTNPFSSHTAEQQELLSRSDLEVFSMNACTWVEVSIGVLAVAWHCNDVAWSMSAMTKWRHCGSLVNQNKSQVKANGKIHMPILLWPRIRHHVSALISHYRSISLDAALSFLVSQMFVITWSCGTASVRWRTCGPCGHEAAVEGDSDLRYVVTFQIESDWMRQIGQKLIFISALLIVTSDEAPWFFQHSSTLTRTIWKKWSETDYLQWTWRVRRLQSSNHEWIIQYCRRRFFLNAQQLTVELWDLNHTFLVSVIWLLCSRRKLPDVWPLYLYNHLPCLPKGLYVERSWPRDYAIWSLDWQNKYWFSTVFIRSIADGAASQ